MQKYIQIGTTAARDPKTGEFLKAVPLYEEATPELQQVETAAFEDVGKLFAGKMKQYIDGGGIIENRAAKSAIR